MYFRANSIAVGLAESSLYLYQKNSQVGINNSNSQSLV
jgi:hypothetical protein